MPKTCRDWNKNAKIDEGVIIGYPPDRNIEKLDLIMGEKPRLRSGTVIYQGSQIGKNFQTGHNVIIREENQIGDNVVVASNSVVDYGCIIGNNVKIHTNVYVAQYTVIEDEVFIAPGVIIANDPHPGCEFSKPCMKGPTIKKGAKIGVNVTLLPYIVIGKKVLIGAGSVVTKDVPDESVVVGNPGKIVGSIYDIECFTGLTDKPYK